MFTIRGTPNSKHETLILKTSKNYLLRCLSLGWGLVKGERDYMERSHAFLGLGKR